MSKAFVDAAASYFGMDPARLHDGSLVSNAEGLAVSFRIKLTDLDIVGVADRMKALAAPVEQEEGKHDMYAMPTMQELMRNPVPYLDRAECQDALTQALRQSSKARQLVREHMAMQETPTEDDDRGTLPPYVWLDPDDCTADQRSCPMSVHPTNGKIAVGVDQLTDEQKIRHAVPPPVPA